MGEFFKGWRRKAGLVTLVMVCLLTAWWMRSYVRVDVLLIQKSQRYHNLGSHRGHLYWISPRRTAPDAISWHSGDTEYARGLRNDQVLPDTAIPYWSLVLPLTLLSAWLILVKPRKAKAATGSTP